MVCGTIFHFYYHRTCLCRVCVGERCTSWLRWPWSAKVRLCRGMERLRQLNPGGCSLTEQQEEEQAHRTAHQGWVLLYCWRKEKDCPSKYPDPRENRWTAVIFNVIRKFEISAGADTFRMDVAGLWLWSTYRSVGKVMLSNLFFLKGQQPKLSYLSCSLYSLRRF